MSVVSISFFRFETLRARLWAFSQMQFARKHLKALPGLEFFKLFGSGTGEGFTPVPNFGVYAILGVWPSEAHARAQIDGDTIYARYHAQSVEAAHIYLQPFSVRGRWDGDNPFKVAASDKNKPAPEPIGVITRATIKKRSVFSFWKHSPGISKDVGQQDSLLFKIGVGEVPWLHQVTISIWSNRKAMVRFAYENGTCHAIAAKEAFDKKWFSEDLFARFHVLSATGRWDGETLEHLKSLSPTQEFV